MYQLHLNKSENILPTLPSGSVDCFFLDPPYLYLNQKWDVEWDEELIFSEITRISKNKAYIIMFGRGVPFARWQTILDRLGWQFKEEIIWSKGYCTSPLMPISRVHETCVIYSTGNAKINKVKVPYLKMKSHDVAAIKRDIKRLTTVFSNAKSLKAVHEFLENNTRDTSDGWEMNGTTISTNITKEDRSVSVMRSLRDGMNEKSIIREDYQSNSITDRGITKPIDKIKNGDRTCDVIQSMEIGMNEKSIINETRDHYNTIHDTQKPVALIERLMRLCGVCEGKNILDPFSGSASSGIAAMNLGATWIGIEMEEKHYWLALERLDGYKNKREYMLF